MKDLMQFLDNSYTCFHAVKNIEELLQKEGFIKLEEDAIWTLEENQKYYVIRNTSSIIAFKIPYRNTIKGFNIVASHSDSPSYKLKPHPTITDVANNYTKLNVEPYGGMIDYTWFDRPLGIAGRVFIENNKQITEKLLKMEETVVIPSVAIHLNRGSDLTFNPQIDLLPVLGDSQKDFEQLLSSYVDAKKVLSTDLFLYNKEKATLVGAHNEYILSSRLDDLECAYASIKSLICANNKNIVVASIFNNEEVGSMSQNGADSTFLVDTLTRIAAALKLDYKMLLASSFMVSADNAHAVHPNHLEKSDATNHVYLNKGIVIKHQAGLRYTTDALSEAIFKQVCNLASVAYQDYTNRSDQRGGSTLGSIALTHLSIPCIDIGLAQLAMHSSLEMAGTFDIEDMYKALTSYYNIQYEIKNGNIVLQ